MISFTERASATLLEVLRREGDPELFLRFRAQGNGCSGYAYDLLFDDVRRKNDRVLTTPDGLVVHVDQASSLLLAGALVDVGPDGDLRIVTPRSSTKSCTSCGIPND